MVVLFLWFTYLRLRNDRQPHRLRQFGDNFENTHAKKMSDRFLELLTWISVYLEEPEKFKILTR